MMIIKRVVATIILAVVILLIPKNVFANTDMLVKNKTNKLTGCNWKGSLCW